jgi:hypothetical protein
MPKLSDLPVATSVSSTDTVPIVQSGVTKEAAMSVIRAPKFVRASSPTAQSIPNDTLTSVIWQSGSITSTGVSGVWAAGNPTRFTVPSGFAYVRLSANAAFSTNATGHRQLRITKNGATTYDGVPATNTSALPSSSTIINISTGLIDVVAGDYFEVAVVQTSGGALNVGGSQNTNFSIEFLF